MVKDSDVHVLDLLLDDPWVTGTEEYTEEYGKERFLPDMAYLVGDVAEGMGAGGYSAIHPRGLSLRLCRIVGSCLSWLRALGEDDPRHTVRTRCDDLALVGVDVTLGGSMTETKRLGALVMVLGDVATAVAAGLPVREVVSDVARLAVVAASWALRLDEAAPERRRRVADARGQVSS